MRGKLERAEKGKEGRKEREKSNWADSSAATLFYMASVSKRG